MSSSSSDTGGASTRFRLPQLHSLLSRQRMKLGVTPMMGAANQTSATSLCSRKIALVISAAFVIALLVIENVSVRIKIREKNNLPWNSLTYSSGDDPAGSGSEGEYLESPQSEGEEIKLMKEEDDDLNIPKEIVEGESTDKSRKPKKIRICTIALNPRQGSLFRTNLLAEYGSGKYRYIVKPSCTWEDRRIRLISYVKCCESLFKVTRAINAAVTEFDIVVVTGDEYCFVTEGRPQFRQYFGSQIISTKNTTEITNYTPNPILNENEGVRFPLYIPLGPREEFLQVRIDPSKDIVPPAERKYLYNFLGSMTSWSRQVLKKVVARDLATQEAQEKYPGFVHITDKWHLKVTKTNGYIEPDEYKRVLLQSVFTLCPTGHNPEAYRIFEALEAGSIPILAIDPWYDRARCNDAFKPFKDSGAPFIYLKGGWRQLESFFEKRGTNATWIKERQIAVLDWYKKWMSAVALRFEAVLEHRYARRMIRGEEDAARERDEILSEEEELEAIKQEEEQDEKFNGADLPSDEEEGDEVDAPGS